METWAEKAAALRARLGRKPTLDEYMAEAHTHTMTPAEVQAQRESWVRSMMPTGDPRFD